MTQEQLDKARERFMIDMGRLMQDNLNQKLTGALATGLVGTIAERVTIVFGPLVVNNTETETAGDENA